MKRFIPAIAFSLFTIVPAGLLRGNQHPVVELSDLDVPGDSPLVYCEDPKDNILDIDKADLIPNDPKAGANLTIKITGDLSEDIKNGSKVEFQVKLKSGAGNIPVLSEDADLCEQLDEKCPVEEGSATFRKTVSIPDDVPSATYLVRVDATNKDDKRITCVEATVKF